jgi:hypothetical protein
VIHTHGSVVFIARPYVYKIKKPVDLGIFDYSSLAKRRFYCEREVELNRRLAPSTYLGVVPIVRAGRSFTLEGSGIVAEYAVKMRYLPEEGMLSTRLDRGSVTAGSARRIAGILSGLYRAEPPASGITPAGALANVRRNSTANFRQMRPLVGAAISHAAWAAARWANAAFLRAHSAALERRAREGWFRNCHGDVRSDSIHVGRHGVTIYDCIEFSDRYRLIDVANDAAFLAMDFDYHGRRDLSRAFIDAMMRGMHDRELPAFVEYYQQYRACVRAKVECLRSAEREVPAPERAASLERAGRYLRLALRYAVGGSGPCVIVVMGRVATGKTTLARALCGELGWPALSSDIVRKTFAGLRPTTHPDAAERKRMYGSRFTDRTYAALLSAAAQAARRGDGIILDATYSSRSRRGDLRRALARAGVEPLFVHLTASDAAILRRLRARESARRVVSDARRAEFELMNRRFKPPTELPSSHLITISGGVSHVLERTLNMLVRRRVKQWGIH